MVVTQVAKVQMAAMVAMVGDGGNGGNGGNGGSGKNGNSLFINFPQQNKDILKVITRSAKAEMGVKAAFQDKAVMAGLAEAVVSTKPMEQTAARENLG